MDNIIIKKIWEDEGLIELKITAISEYVTAYQNCYIDIEKLNDISNEICCYSYDYDKNFKIQFGEDSEEYTPSFLMTILKADMNGRGKVEVNGVAKTSNGGRSTFFPESWTAQEVVDAINEAFNNKEFVPGTSNTYIGEISNGMQIEMYINNFTNKIISAFPIQ